MSPAAPTLQHAPGFRLRRAANWIPLGLTYALLYMGRYNLTVSKNALGDLMSNEQFGTIFGAGTAVYAFAFLFNGPLTDRIGGRLAILMAAAGTAVMNLLMGLYTYNYVTEGTEGSLTLAFSLLYSGNMYFQSFGAVAIVKVNSNWFHVRERGTFSAIFGSIISLGLLLAFDIGSLIVTLTEGLGPGGVDATWWVFFIPAILLGVFFILDLFLVRNLPSECGLGDFDTGAARLTADDAPLPTGVLLKKILTHPVILTVGAIEFCTGVLRNGVMHWYPIYTKSALALESSHLMRASWGTILFVAGVTGGIFGGLISDKLFGARRGPAAGTLYGGLTLAVVAMSFSLGGTEPRVGWLKSPIKPAAAAGLHAGDLIYALDGAEVQDRARFIATLSQPGQYRLGVWRAGEAHEVVLTTDAPTLKDLALRKNLVTERALEIAGEPRTALHWRGSWAAEVGLAKDDLIASVNGAAPKDWEEVHSLLRTDGTPNQLVVQRAAETLALEVRYPPYAPQQREERARYLEAGPVQKLDPLWLGALAFFISLCVIGTHGLLSGTATMDFGGKRGAATAVGVIDGLVYAGTAVQSFSLGFLTERVGWAWWPVFLLPFAIIGFALTLKIWHAHPDSRRGGH